MTEQDSNPTDIPDRDPSGSSEDKNSDSDKQGGNEGKGNTSDSGKQDGMIWSD